MPNSPDKQLVIFTSQSGISIRECLARLRESLHVSLRKGIEVVSLEDDNIGDNVRTSVLASSALEKIVVDGYQQGINKVNESKSNIFFVHLHSCFWKKSTGFTVVDKLHELVIRNPNLKVKCIITLIDDFYNVYFRIKDHYAQSGISETLTPLDILSWRSVEIMLARLLSNSLNVPHFLVSVNHSVKVLQDLLFGEHIAVYAGHPISEVRRKFDVSERKSMIDKINNDFLMHLFADNNVALFIPDTIDERPIFALLENETSSRTYENLIKEIWPRVWLDPSHNALGSPIQKKLAEKYFDELCRFILQNKSGLLDVVNDQISDRDYRLVNQSEAFAFVLLNGISSSRGVMGELNYAKSIYKKTHFFNPDGMEPNESSSIPAPNWASAVTGTHSNISELIRVMKKHGLNQPYIS